MHNKEVEPSSSGRSKIGVTGDVMMSQKSGSIRKLHTREGASAAYQDINGNARQSQRCELRRAVANDGAERFSDIDDHEVMKYIHSKKEMRYKRMIWEVMNRDYVKPKKQKQAKDVKKATPAKRAAKITSPIEDKKKLSSKINYDVLKNLFDEPFLEEVSHQAKGEGTQSDFGSHGNKLSNEKANNTAHNEDRSEFEDGSEDNEEVNESDNYYDDLYNGNEEDENWDEYDHEEY